MREWEEGNGQDCEREREMEVIIGCKGERRTKEESKEKVALVEVEVRDGVGELRRIRWRRERGLGITG